MSFEFIDREECIGDSLIKINTNAANFNTRINDLLSLINTLSSNMQNIGNHPYIEYGWVTAPNAAGQNIPANTITTLTLNTKVTDTGNLAGAPSSNQFTLPAGTYYYEAQTRLRNATSVQIASTLSLYNITTSQFVSRSGVGATTGHAIVRSLSMRLNGNMQIAASTTFELRLLTGSAATVDNGDGSNVFTNSTAGADQRTTIKLWKVG